MIGISLGIGAAKGAESITLLKEKSVTHTRRRDSRTVAA